MEQVEIPSIQKLFSRFDCVVMLTRSDWFREPRSNRYHYATRFARHFPVLFVQPTADNGEELRVKPSGYENIDVAEVSDRADGGWAAALKDLLRFRGLKRPILWIYGDGQPYSLFMDLFLDAFLVYHATEDYFTPNDCWMKSQQRIMETMRESICRLLPSIDLLIAVSPAVAESYRRNTQYEGRIFIAPNGCDAAFFSEFAEKAQERHISRLRRVAIFQGGINRRLDIELLHRLIHILPEWEFWFCGLVDETFKDWRTIKAHPNVRHFGLLSPEEMAELACSATVGLIPFEKCDWIRNSLPLKAFEYVACKLPVVTVPIDALKPYPDQFTFASTAEEFAHAMECLAETRFDPVRVTACQRIAYENSYDRHFNNVLETIARTVSDLELSPRKLNILILYDDRWTHIGTVQEHVKAFCKYSRHHIFLLPASASPVPDVDLSVFDVVIHHYAVRLSLPDYLNENLAKRLSEFNGLKILFIQDEYDTVETARRWIERLKFDVIYTCIPRDGIEYVYPSQRFPWVEFLPTLTGYVPEVGDLDQFALPIEKREIRIGYRGRKLAYGYGLLGQEKYRIGVDVRSLANQRGIRTDIEVDDLRRIYGIDWYRFIGSVRATLGTESGSNVFDFDGSIHEAVRIELQENPTATFEEIFNKIVAPHEGRVRMNQVSPKVFEAIRLQTALILFEGEYSGVVLPNVHYIPLQKDYSNIDDVFAKLEDIPFLQSLTQRAFDDVIGSGKYSYRTFVQGIDEDIEARLLHQARSELFATPMLARMRSGEIRPMFPTEPLGCALSTGLLYGDFQRERLVEILRHEKGQAAWTTLPAAPSVQDPASSAPQCYTVPEGRSLSRRIVFGCWRLLPSCARVRLRCSAAMIRKRWPLPASEKTLMERIVGIGWRTLPEFVRRRIRGLVPD